MSLITWSAPASLYMSVTLWHSAIRFAGVRDSYSSFVYPITELPSITPTVITPAFTPSLISATVSPTLMTFRTEVTPSASILRNII